jgi:hypothetical protein
MEQAYKALLDEVYTPVAPVAPWPELYQLGDTAPLPVFPTEALPEWLQAFVEAEAESLQVPPDMPALICLAVVATCVQRRVTVYPRAGWVVPTSLYTVVALPPSDRKSPSFSSAVAPLNTWEKKEALRLAPTIAEAQSDKKILESRLAKAQNAAAAAQPGDRGVARDEAAVIARELATHTVPSVPRLIADNVTPEKLGDLLVAHDGRMAVLSAEGTIFEIIAGRYSQKPNLEVFLGGYSGDTHRVDRLTRTEYVDRAALTIGVTIQPGMLAGLSKTQDFVDKGLLARFLFSVPTSLSGHREIAPNPTPSAVRDAYEARVTALLEGLDNGPHAVWFDVDADHALRDFEREIEPQLAEDGAMGHVRDWGGKLCGLVVRICGLLHMAHYGAAGVATRINEATVINAIAIGRYAKAHALHAFGVMGADPDLAAAQRVWKWIERSGKATVTKREIYEGVKGGATFKKAEALDAPLRLLEAQGYIRAVAQPAKRSAGRPTEEYEVRPVAPAPAPAPSGATYADPTPADPTPADLPTYTIDAEGVYHYDEL